MILNPIQILQIKLLLLVVVHMVVCFPHGWEWNILIKFKVHLQQALQFYGSMVQLIQIPGQILPQMLSRIKEVKIVMTLLSTDFMIWLIWFMISINGKHSVINSICAIAEDQQCQSMLTHSLAPLLTELVVWSKLIIHMMLEPYQEIQLKFSVRKLIMWHKWLKRRHLLPTRPFQCLIGLILMHW